MKAYSIRDSKTSSYYVPLFAHDDNHAERIVFEASLDQKTHFHRYPEDFSLFAVGEFDSENCMFTNEAPAPRCLGVFVDIIHRQCQRRYSVEDIMKNYSTEDSK